MEKNARTPRFDKEWHELLNLIPADRRDTMYDAIRNYQLSGTEPQHLNGAETMAFKLIKKIVDRRAKMREARQRRRIAKCENSAKQTVAKKMPKEEEPATPREKFMVNGIDMNPELIERDEKGAIIIRSSEDMIRYMRYSRMTRQDPTKRIVFRYVGT